MMGAANMAGQLSGLATRIQDDEPKALFVHCTAYSVNLSCKNVENN